jgi:nucleoside-diphosphate-sugar epimerase
MNQAVVMAAGQFLGFEICKALLEEGYEVVGLDDICEENRGLIEQKWLEVGRNANFSAGTMDEREVCLTKPTFIFLPIFDYYFHHDVYFQRLQQIQHNVSQWSLPPKNEFIFILPTQMLYERNERVEDVKEVLQKMKTWMEDKRYKITDYYVPTVYGPYQPEVFLFHQLLKKNLYSEPSNIEFMDDPSDAIYVQDAAVSIIQHVLSGKKEEKGPFLLSSGEKNRWKNIIHKITSYTNQYLLKEERKYPLTVKQIPISQQTPLEEGLERQAVCIQNYLK